MARIRTVKPEFWTSEQVLRCSRDARLFFIGLWNFCDDGGRHPLKIRNLLIKIFPGDEDIGENDIRRMVDELFRNRLISAFEANGDIYLQVTGWSHQKIDRPSYRHPKSGTPVLRLPFDEGHPPEGRKEVGKDGSIDPSSSPTTSENYNPQASGFSLNGKPSPAGQKKSINPEEFVFEIESGAKITVSDSGVVDVVSSPLDHPKIRLRPNEALAMRAEALEAAAT